MAEFTRSVTPPERMNFGQKVGHVLQSFAQPEYLQGYNKALQMDALEEARWEEMNRRRALEEKQMQEQEARKSALQRLAAEMQGGSVVPETGMGPMQPQGPMDAMSALARMAEITGDPSGLIKYQMEAPQQELDRKLKLAQIAEASRTKLEKFQNDEGDVYTFDPYTGATSMVYDAPAVAPGPESPLGKMALDVQRGFVPEETYLQEAGLTPKVADMSKVTIPGFDIAPGAVPTPEDAQKLKTVAQAKSQLDKLIGDYSEMIDAYGFEVEGSQDAKKIQQKEAQIQLQMKNLEELGALQAPDLAVLTRMMGSPVGEDMFGPEWLRQPWNAWNTKARSKEQAGDFQQYVDDRMKSAMFTRGYVPKEGSTFSDDPLGLFKK